MTNEEAGKIILVIKKRKQILKAMENIIKMLRCNMKEFVKKLISRLEEEIFSAELYNNEFNGQTVDNLLCLGNVNEIVNQLAEEYINCSTDTSSGWISCSERLPELTEGTEFFKQSKCCLTTLKWWDGDMTESVGWYNQSGAWNEDSKNCKVVAWMPLPEPFTPKEGRE